MDDLLTKLENGEVYLPISIGGMDWNFCKMVIIGFLLGRCSPGYDYDHRDYEKDILKIFGKRLLNYYNENR